MGAKNSTQTSGEGLEKIDKIFFENKKNGKPKAEKGCNECQIKKKEEEKKVIVNKKCRQCER